MKLFIYFFLALGTLLLLQSGRSDTVNTKSDVINTTVPVDSAVITVINEQLPVSITVIDNPRGITPAEIVKYLLDTLGALLTTFVLAWLHKKFPNVFKSRKPKDYNFK